MGQAIFELWYQAGEWSQNSDPLGQGLHNWRAEGDEGINQVEEKKWMVWERALSSLGCRSEHT